MDTPQVVHFAAEMGAAEELTRRFQPLLASFRASGTPVERVCCALVMLAAREAVHHGGVEWLPHLRQMLDWTIQYAHESEVPKT